MSAQCWPILVTNIGCTNAKTYFNVHIGAILAERRVLLAIPIQFRAKMLVKIAWKSAAGNYIHNTWQARLLYVNYITPPPRH